MLERESADWARYGLDGVVLLDNGNITVHQSRYVVVFFEPDVEKNTKLKVLIDDILNDKYYCKLTWQVPSCPPHYLKDRRIGYNRKTKENETVNRFNRYIQRSLASARNVISLSQIFWNFFTGYLLDLKIAPKK